MLFNPRGIYLPNSEPIKSRALPGTPACKCKGGAINGFVDGSRFVEERDVIAGFPFSQAKNIQRSIME